MDHIISQDTEYKLNKERISVRLKTTSRRKGPKLKNIILSRIREHMSKDKIRANDTLQQPGCQNWLNNIPIEEFNYNLNKQQFLDAMQQDISLYHIYQHGVLVTKNLIHNMQCLVRREIS